ncbi:30S ribosomal protein S17 [Candidatus Wolfebacteria bacterium]|nr:30S ribosomal protein S17 [Candidatus Wolfebacteria bacterium]
MLGFNKKENKNNDPAKAEEKKLRKLEGIVVSDKMQKTVIVAVSRMKMHPKYKKYFKITKKYKAHDEKNEYHKGDTVVIVATRPLSKEKRWRVVSKV